MQVLAEGQFVKHAQYGLGVVKESGPERTSIDFHFHGMKKFVTGLMTVELTDEAPPPKPHPARRKKLAKISTQTPPFTIAVIGK